MTKHCKSENKETHQQDDSESDVRPEATLIVLGADFLADGSGMR